MEIPKKCGGICEKGAVPCGVGWPGGGGDSLEAPEIVLATCISDWGPWNIPRCEVISLTSATRIAPPETSNGAAVSVSQVYQGHKAVERTHMQCNVISFVDRMGKNL